MKRVNISQSHFPHLNNDLDFITCREVERGKCATDHAVLVEAWSKFYAEAIDGGQIPTEFKFEFIEDIGAEVILKAPRMSEYPEEVFVLTVEDGS